MKSIKLIQLFDYIIKFCTMHNKNNNNSFYCNKHIYNRESKKNKISFIPIKYYNEYILHR